MAFFYQTPGALITVAIIEDPEGGAISIGIARAGKRDLKEKLVTPEGGMEVAEGRAKKAMESKSTLIKKNYLRGFYAQRTG